MRIHDESQRREECVSAIKLLRSIGDRSAMQWVDVLLKSRDPAIQHWLLDWSIS